MKEKTKKLISLAVVSVFFFTVSAACFVYPQKDFSDYERRSLAKLPEISFSSITSGRFMANFEDYTLDQFPLRDSFRTIKAAVSKHVFRKSDNNDIFVINGNIGKIEYPMKQSSLTYATKKFSDIYETYLKDKGCKVYLSVIPDKSAFIAEKNGYPSMDYERFYEEMKKGTPFAEYIDIAPLLEEADYYKTDTHWRQEKITDVAEKIAAAMDVKIGEEYTEKTLEKDFYGVYYGQAALPVKPDKLHYLTNEVIDGYKVYDHQNGKQISAYDMEKAKGKDPYEIFLSGSLSLIEIENPMGEEGRELVIFRDSFASSITPLLAQGYSKVYLADIRYMSSAMLENYISFENKDVLFLYSTLVLNNSSTFK